MSCFFTNISQAEYHFCLEESRLKTQTNKKKRKTPSKTKPNNEKTNNPKNPETHNPKENHQKKPHKATVTRQPNTDF